MIEGFHSHSRVEFATSVQTLCSVDRAIVKSGCI